MSDHISQASQNTCPRCGAATIPGEHHCRQCGAPRFDGASTPGGPLAQPRPIALRIIAGVLWFLVVDLLFRMVVGGIVGASTFCNASFQDCVEVGKSASIAFFSKYNGVVYFGSIALTVLLASKGILPGTAAARKTR